MAKKCKQCEHFKNDDKSIYKFMKDGKCEYWGHPVFSKAAKDCLQYGHVTIEAKGVTDGCGHTFSDRLNAFGAGDSSTCILCLNERIDRQSEQIKAKELVEKRLRKSWEEACVEAKQYQQAAEHWKTRYDQSLKGGVQ